jgi:hypothetical protein
MTAHTKDNRKISLRDGSKQIEGLLVLAAIIVMLNLNGKGHQLAEC